MENLSRVRKNAELRQTIENSRESELVSDALSPFANRLNRISPDLSTVETTKNSTPNSSRHAKTDNDPGFEPYVSQVDPTFHRDILNEFIDEVKHYNLKNGYASVDSPKVAPQPQAVPTTVPQADDDALTLEIKRAILSEASESDVESKPLKEETEELHGVLEETAKIKIKLENVDKELLEMNRSVNRSNRALNVITFVLVIVLVVMLGIAVYWILTTEGM